MPPQKRKRPRKKAVELDPAQHAKNKAYGRRYRKNREQVLARSRLCAYQFEGCTSFAVETDHVVEAGRGGPSTVDNLAPCCRNCNQKKKYGRRTPELATAPPARFPSSADSPCPHQSFDGRDWCPGEVGHWSRWWWGSPSDPFPVLKQSRYPWLPNYEEDK